MADRDPLTRSDRALLDAIIFVVSCIVAGFSYAVLCWSGVLA